MKWLSLIVLCFAAFTAQSEPIHKIVWLTTSAVTQQQIKNAQAASNTATLHYFKVDEEQRILNHFQSIFPKELNTESEQVKNTYLNEHITPHVKTYMPEIMRSKMGVSLAKFYKIKRIPAVVINDEYVTYGLTVAESIAQFNKVQ